MQMWKNWLVERLLCFSGGFCTLRCQREDRSELVFAVEVSGPAWYLPSFTSQHSSPVVPLSAWLLLFQPFLQFLLLACFLLVDTFFCPQHWFFSSTSANSLTFLATTPWISPQNIFVFWNNTSRTFLSKLNAQNGTFPKGLEKDPMKKSPLSDDTADPCFVRSHLDPPEGHRVEWRSRDGMSGMQKDYCRTPSLPAKLKNHLGLLHQWLVMQVSPFRIVADVSETVFESLSFRQTLYLFPKTFDCAMTWLLFIFFFSPIYFQFI